MTICDFIPLDLDDRLAEAPGLVEVGERLEVPPAFSPNQPDNQVYRCTRLSDGTPQLAMSSELFIVFPTHEPIRRAA